MSISQYQTTVVALVIIAGVFLILYVRATTKLDQMTALWQSARSVMTPSQLKQVEDMEPPQLEPGDWHAPSP